MLWSNPQLWGSLWRWFSICKWGFLIFFSLSLVRWTFNPPWVSFCFSIFLGLVSLLLLHPHTLSMTFSSPSFSMSPLFTFVLCWLVLDKPNSSDPWYLVLALAFHRIEQIWGSMLSLSLPFAQHTRHLNSCQSGRRCRDQCSAAFCQAITTLHQQPRHLSPPTHTYVPLCHYAFTFSDYFSVSQRSHWIYLLTIICLDV